MLDHHHRDRNFVRNTSQASSTSVARSYVIQIQSDIIAQYVWRSSFSGDCYETVCTLYPISGNIVAKSIPSVIHRLEAATSRLEDLADEQARRAPRATSAPEERPTSYTAAPAAASPPAPPPPPPPPPVVPMSEVPQSVIAYDQTVIEEKLKPFVETTRSLGGECLIEQVSRVNLLTNTDPFVSSESDICLSPGDSS
jgi:hypothetical protein